MYAQPIRHEMAVTLTPHLSKQSSSVFMNSNEICFFASNTQTGSCEIQSIEFVSRPTCMIVEVVKKRLHFKYHPFKTYNLTPEISTLTSLPRLLTLSTWHNTQKNFVSFSFIIFYSSLTPSYSILDSLPHWMTHVGRRHLVGSSARHLTSHTHTCPPPPSITGPHSVP